MEEQKLEEKEKTLVEQVLDYKPLKCKFHLEKDLSGVYIDKQKNFYLKCFECLKSEKV